MAEVERHHLHGVGLGVDAAERHGQCFLGERRPVERGACRGEVRQDKHNGRGHRDGHGEVRVRRDGGHPNGKRNFLRTIIRQ